ncbi:ATP synthase protein I [Bartonella quintana]|uniref:AtpZ/AtpI family protein n=1 Tax=Bartonella quintana TaxID=803 RepID=UPI0013182B88|nr:AtpZ/AtpI family protein [Bartonella quintana]BBL53054.1 ATP synthase protein I [Bartonella quintana]
MAKGNERVVPQEEAEGKRQEDCFHSVDLECRSQNLGLALIPKEALKRYKCEKGREPKGIGSARAVKLSSEFLASIIVGVVLGLGFDKLVGSLPWGLVFFLFLGFAAGVLNILRSVGYIASSRLEQRGASRQDKRTDKRSNK